MHMAAGATGLDVGVRFMDSAIRPKASSGDRQ